MLPSDEDEYSVTDCLKCLSEEMWYRWMLWSISDI
jgi:hypothetical protein